MKILELIKSLLPLNEEKRKEFLKELVREAAKGAAEGAMKAYKEDK